MNRRSFLASLAAAFVVDPERLLYVPGKKLISIPKPALVTTGWADKPAFDLGDMVAIQDWWKADPRTRCVIPGTLQRFIVTKPGNKPNFEGLTLTPWPE